jgi:hypothetical protein
MAIIINRTQEIQKKLDDQNDSKVLNTPDDIALIHGISRHMEEVRRDYQVKERKSQTSAASVILTA